MGVGVGKGVWQEECELCVWEEVEEGVIVHIDYSQISTALLIIPNTYP